MSTGWEVDDRIRSTAISTLEFSGATARLVNQPFTNTFTELAQSRRPGFYLMIFAVLVLALAGSATGMILLKESWLQLLLAGALGVIFTQFAFLGHEASHRQIFQSGQANDRAGQVLAALVGLSHGWWMNKHSRHHANPNKIGKDPDIESDTVAFLDESAATGRGVRAWFTRRQGYLFFPLLLLEGLNLHVKAITSLSSRSPVKGRWIEVGMLTARFIIFSGWSFGYCHLAWRGHSSGYSLPSSASTWARPSRLITRACRSCQPTSSSTSLASRCVHRATSLVAGGRRS